MTIRANPTPGSPERPKLHIPELAHELRALRCVRCGCGMAAAGHGSCRDRDNLYTSCPSCAQVHHVVICNLHIKGKEEVIEVWVPFVVEALPLETILGGSPKIALSVVGLDQRISEVRGILDRWSKADATTPFEEYVASRLMADPESWLSTRDLYDDYQEWYRGDQPFGNRELHYDIKSLVDAIKLAGIDIRPVRWHNEKGYVGVRFRFRDDQDGQRSTVPGAAIDETLPAMAEAAP